MTGFGASGPIEALYPHFGITAEAVAAEGRSAALTAGAKNGGSSVAWKTLDDMDLTGKVVLTRVDINVPVEDGQGHRRDPDRAHRADGPGHPGEGRQAGAARALRPAEGQGRAGDEPERDAAGARGGARPAGRLRRGLRRRRRRERRWRRFRAGGVLLLENTRFHKGEEANDPALRRRRWRRSATSTATTPSRRRTGRMPRPRALARLLPACAGRLMQAELEALEKALGQPGAAGGGGGRRRQGLDQARAARQPDRPGRHAGDRRGHGQHLPRGAGDRRRQVALRA